MTMVNPSVASEDIKVAISFLRTARKLLIMSGASRRCVDKVRRAITSAQGAHRHAVNKTFREARP